MSTDFIVIIPARMAASRLPGKPLLKIGDKPLIQHVYEQARESKAKRIVIATDSLEIEKAAIGFDAEVIMTSEKHQSGTDRIAEACQLLGLSDEQIIVNVQGDEFMLPYGLIEQTANNLDDYPDAAIATLCEKITAVDEKNDPNIVKVVFDHEGMALYFSRSAIPYAKGDNSAWRHIGLYAYRVGFLQKFCQLTPSELEKLEKLEQLRAMSHGYRIHVSIASDNPAVGIDTEADLERARQLFNELN